MFSIRTFASAWSARLTGRRLAASQAVLLLAALGFLSPAQAADPAPATASAFADTSKPVMFLKQTVVTGARYPRAYYESPQALSFVTRSQIRDQAPTVIGDVLGTLPGVANSKDSPWEQRPVLRGLGGQRVLVMMDGSPMNSARGNGPHPSLVDESQIERVEVVRGPSSVSYGSDALGGVINIITREAPPAPDGKTHMTGGASIGGSTADNQYNGSLSLAPRVGKFSSFLGGGFRHTDDFTAPSGTIPHSSFKDYNFIGNLRGDLTERLSLKGGYQMYRGDKIGIPGLSSPTQDYGLGNTTVFKFDYYDRDLAHLTLDEKYNNSWLASSMVKVYYQTERRNFFSTEHLDASGYGAAQPPKAPNGSAYRQTDQDRFFNLNTWGAQLQMSSARTSRYFYTLGIDLTRDITDGDNVRHRADHFSTTSGDSVGAVAVRVTQSVPNGNFDNYAGYWQNQMTLNPQWTGTLGLRWTQYRYRSEAGLAVPGAGPSPPVYFAAKSVDAGAPSGSLGLVYAPAKDLHLTFNVANGYRQPNAQELFFDGQASVGWVIGNADLNAEKSISYDVGARWGPGDVAVSASAYYSTYDDLIDAVSVPPVPEANGQPTYQYVNISKARIWGGEVEGEWRATQQIRLRAAASGAVGDQTDPVEAPLPNIPPFAGTVGVRWTDAQRGVWIEPSARYSWRTNRLPLTVSGVPQIGAFKKEWFVGDVTAGWNIPSGQKLIVGVRNVADVTYRLPLGSLDEPGRSFFGSLSTTF